MKTILETVLCSLAIICLWVVAGMFIKSDVEWQNTRACDTYSNSTKNSIPMRCYAYYNIQ